MDKYFEILLNYVKSTSTNPIIQTKLCLLNWLDWWA